MADIDEHKLGVPNEHDDVQFDQAEYEAPPASGPVCNSCQQSIADEYYEINGKVVCGSCRQGIVAALRGGSRIARMLKALALGSLAALVGAVLYYLFVTLTHINFGLVAVLLGFMVGGAVKKGSANRGGRFYQLLGVFLAYSAIVGMHVPGVINELREWKADEPPQPPAVVKKAPVQPGELPANPFAGAPSEEPKAKLAAAEGQPAPKEVMPADPKPTAMNMGLALAVLLALFYAAPMLYAFQDPISGLIYSFALWEAWKINRKVKLSFNGPFRVNTQDPDEGEVDGDADGG